MKAYLSTKPRDIRFPSLEDLLITPPFVKAPDAGEVDAAFASVDFTTVCPVLKENGVCRHGLKCRFLGGHARKADNEYGIEVLKDQNREDERRNVVSERNSLGPGTLKQLRTKQVCTLFEFICAANQCVFSTRRLLRTSISRRCRIENQLKKSRAKLMTKMGTESLS